MSEPSPLAAELESWIQRFRGPLVGYLASRGASWREAEELAMDTFAEAWLGRARMRGPLDDLTAIAAWLRGIAHNLLFAQRRRLARREAPLPAAEPAAPAVQRDERYDTLRAAFAQLRPEFQEVLRMHYLEATTAREVAALLGETVKAIEGRLYQARRALRALVDAAAAREEQRA
jgi:RNA polymerase sigma-70 factor (ECF subfamily)